MKIAENMPYQKKKKKGRTQGRKMISVEVLVAASLRHLGKGHDFEDTLYRESFVSGSFLLKFHHRFMEALCGPESSFFKSHVYWPEEGTEEMRQGLAVYAALGMPGCVASVDGTHIPYDYAPNDVVSWYRRCLEPPCSVPALVPVCTAASCTDILLYHSVRYHSVLYRSVLCRSVLYRSVMYRFVLYRSALYHYVLYPSVLYHSLLYHSLLYHSVLSHSVLYLSLLYHSLLYHSVLYHSVLYPSVLYHLMLWFPLTDRRLSGTKVRGGSRLSCITCPSLTTVAFTTSRARIRERKLRTHSDCNCMLVGDCAM